MDTIGMSIYALTWGFIFWASFASYHNNRAGRGYQFWRFK